MKVFKRSGSSYYAYKFQYRGKEYYRSTGTENRREAEALAAVARARVIRQAAGLEEPDPPSRPLAIDASRNGIPTLRQFQTIFDEWVATAKAEQNGNSFLTALGPISALMRLTRRRSNDSKLGL